MDIWKKITLVMLLCTAIVCQLAAGDYFIRDFKLNRKNGIYKIGETADLTGTVTFKDQPATEGTLRCNIKWEGKTVKSVKIPLDGKAFKISYKSDKPGWCMFDLLIYDKNGKLVKKTGTRQLVVQSMKRGYLIAEIGVMFAPEKIRSTAPVPADFEEFWKNQRAKLDAIPIGGEIKEIQSPSPEVKLYSLKLNCLGDAPATGYFAIPAKTQVKGHPALVNFVSWVWSDAGKTDIVKYAQKGLIAVNLSWHGIETGLPKAAYIERGKVLRKENFSRKFIDQPEKWFFGHSYMRVLRALDYVKSRPEWNGKDLIVRGGSLGASLAACGAALDKDVSMALVNIPGFCEFNAHVDGRKRAVPFTAWEKGTEAENKGAGYFDLVNLAKYINCEIYVSTGFTDERCTPSSVIAFYNNLPESNKHKQLYTNPRSGHYGTTYNAPGENRLRRLIAKFEASRKAE